MSEKMRDEFEKVERSRQDWLYSDSGSNVFDVDSSGNYMNPDRQLRWEDWCKSWQAALRTHENGGQDSEAGAVAIVEWFEVRHPQCRGFVPETPHAILTDEGVKLPHGTKLYLTPPSAQAIETATIMRAAEVMDEKSEAGCTADWFMAKTAILALIPQDGRTALEEFGMKVAGAAWAKGRMNSELSDCEPIVTNLIGETKDTKGVGE